MLFIYILKWWTVRLWVCKCCCNWIEGLGHNLYWFQYEWQSSLPYSTTNSYMMLHYGECFCCWITYASVRSKYNINKCTNCIHCNTVVTTQSSTFNEMCIEMRWWWRQKRTKPIWILFINGIYEMSTLYS